MVQTRRERLHDATREEIKNAAREQMKTEGTAAVSLRAIARALGMTAPALYRYYGSRDELITALILDAFNAQADAMLDAYNRVPADNPLQQMTAVMLVYRSWAVAHRVDFHLIFGNPIPDYHQSPEVATLTGQASARSFEPLARAIETATRMGLIVPPAEYVNLPAAILAPLKAQIEQHGYDISPTTFYLVLMAWGHGHGLIMLELDGHLQPIVGDPAALYAHRVADLLRQMGATVRGEPI